MQQTRFGNAIAVEVLFSVFCNLNFPVVAAKCQNRCDSWVWPRTVPYLYFDSYFLLSCPWSEAHRLCCLTVLRAVAFIAAFVELQEYTNANCSCLTSMPRRFYLDSGKPLC